MECIEMEEPGEPEKVGLLSKSELEIGIGIEDWVGVHSFKTMPDSFKSQESMYATMFCTPLVESIKAHLHVEGDPFRKNRMATVFCSPQGDETGVLKLSFKKIARECHKFHPIPRYKIILVEAKNPDTLKQSFKKVVGILDRKVDTKTPSDSESDSDEETADKIYNQLKSETGPKDQSLFVFAGAAGFDNIKQFLPHENFLLPFCQFVVTTSSKTFSWESEEWSIETFLLFDKQLTRFDWEGVHSASKLPPSFRPCPDSDFAAGEKVTSQLVQRFLNFSRPPLQGSSRASGSRSKSLTAITGSWGKGKTEVVKKFLSTHHHLFSKVILLAARSETCLWNSIKVCAYNLGFYSETKMGEKEGHTKKQTIVFVLSQISKHFQQDETVLFVFDDVESLKDLEDHLPNNAVICDWHVIVTSPSRYWKDEEDLKFYRDHGYDFQELPLFDGLSLDQEQTAAVDQSELENEIGSWVGIHKQESIQELFKHQEFPTINFSELERTLYWERSKPPSEKPRPILFCSSIWNQTLALKQLFQGMKNPKHCDKLYRIIVLDAKNSENLKHSFETCFPNIKIDLLDQDRVDEMYKMINGDSDPKTPNLFLFIGAKGFDRIKAFLPRGNFSRLGDQFLVTTCSKTSEWESEESERKEWNIQKYLSFDNNVIAFDWEGDHPPLKLPRILQPLPHFAGRVDEMKKLVQRFQNSSAVPLAETKEQFRHCYCCKHWRDDKKVLPQPSSRPPRTLTVITGFSGIGKLELVKQFLWLHPSLFTKVVLADFVSESSLRSAQRPRRECREVLERSNTYLKIFARNSGIHSLFSMDLRPEKACLPYSTLTKHLPKNSRVLFLFKNVTHKTFSVESLQEIKNYLPTDISCDVIVTSRSRNWEKEEDVKFYRENGYDFQEIPIFEGLSLDETHKVCSKILPKHGIFYLRKDLEESTREFDKLTGGFPPALQKLAKSISESSGSNPEWPKLHMLNYLRQHPRQVFSFPTWKSLIHRAEESCYILNNGAFQLLMHFHPEPETEAETELTKKSEMQVLMRMEMEFPNMSGIESGKSLVDSETKVLMESKKESLLLLQIISLMDPEHLELDIICYFYLVNQNPQRPPEQKLEKQETDHVKDLLRVLELDAYIQLNRGKEGDQKKLESIQIPTFLTEIYRKLADRLDKIDGFRQFLTSPSCLDDHRFLPHILSFHESFTRHHRYCNAFLIQCVQNYLPLLKQPRKVEVIPGEVAEQEKEKTQQEQGQSTSATTTLSQNNGIKMSKPPLFEHPGFKAAFGDFPTVSWRDFVLPVFFLTLFLVDVGLDVNSAIIILRAGYTSYFFLVLFLLIVPFIFLCRLHKIDRANYNLEMNKGNLMSRGDYLSTFTGTTDSFRLQLLYIWRFRRETDDLERGLLFERLCVLKANTEYQGICEAFMESLPQLLLQFSLYLLSFTQEHSELSKVMRESLIPFELSLVVSLSSLGFALTKLESIY